MTDVVTAIFHQKWLVRVPGTALKLDVNKGAGHAENGLVIHVGATVPEETRIKDTGQRSFNCNPIDLNSLMLWSLGLH